MAPRRKIRLQSDSSFDYDGAEKSRAANDAPNPLKELPPYILKKCHQTRSSLFNSGSGFDNYRGFLNLCVVLMLVSNARIFLENLYLYGILVNPVQWFNTVMHEPYKLPNLMLILISNVFILFAHRLERWIVTGDIGSGTAVYLHIMNLVVVLVLPPIHISRTNAAPLGSAIACAIYVVIFLKLWSYAQANSWYRDEYNKKAQKRKELKRIHSLPASKVKKVLSEEDDKSDTYTVTYPFNVSKSNLYYFIFAPTLCYEPSYPRNKLINKGFLIQCIIEFLFLVQLELALTQQWIVPTIKQAIPYMTGHVDNGTALDSNYHVVDLFMRLAVPNHFLWLLMFYFLFHSLLNATAEVLRFADREFYRDWWNADTIPYFWKAWNIPVHKWCVRHVYKPIVSSGYSKFTASLVVFLLSAFFHEYLVSIPLQLVRAYAFLGMLVQIPLSFLTEMIVKHHSPHLGNMVVWLSLIWGQPLAILGYVNDYFIKVYNMEHGL